MWFTGSGEGEGEESYGGCSSGWRFQCENLNECNIFDTQI